MSFKDFSNLIRLPLGIMASISGLASAFVVILLQNTSLNLIDAGYKYLGQIIIGLPIPFLITCGAMAFNDYYDYEADLKNGRKDRPLTSGKFSKKFALYLSLIMMTIGGLLTLVLWYFWPYRVETIVFPAVLLFIAISVSYSTWLKKYGLLGNIAVSLSYPAAMMLAMGVIGVTDTNAIISISAFVTMIFLLALGREILKGVMDSEGDKAQGVKTIAVRYGPKKAAYFCTFLFILSLPFSPIPLFLAFIPHSIISSVIYIICIAFALILFIRSGLNLIVSPSKEVGIKGRKQTKLGFWFIVLGFFTATLILGIK